MSSNSWVTQSCGPEGSLVKETSPSPVSLVLPLQPCPLYLSQSSILGYVGGDMHNEVPKPLT